MGYLIALEDVTPPARSDERPWLTAVIEESPSLDGSWSALETVAFDPPDEDPSNPQPRSFSTSNATLAAGWYRLTLDDGNSGTYTMNAVRLARVWAPTEADVASLIRARTKVPGGKEVGTFNENTRPTAEQVRRLIDQAVDHVLAAIGGEPCNDQLRESAKACATLLAAILIEQSYWPEQAEARGSSAARLESLFNARMKSLTAAVAEQCGGQGEGSTGGEGSNAGAVAAGSFNDGYPLIGRDYPPRW